MELKVESIFKEEDILELLGVSEFVLRRLRNELGLPYISVTPTVRLYLEADLMRWFMDRRKNIVSDSTDA